MSRFPDDLYSAAFTGSLPASPLVAEITRVAAAVVATLLAAPPARAVVPANGQICTAVRGGHRRIHPAGT